MTTSLTTIALKVDELSKRRSDFETTKADIISRLADEEDPWTGLGILEEAVKNTCEESIIGQLGIPDQELQWKSLDTFMVYAKYEPSVTAERINTWKEWLLSRLEIQSSRYEYASLYAQLLAEHIKILKDSAVSRFEKRAENGWENTIFEPVHVDSRTLGEYFVNLFHKKGEQPGQEPMVALRRLRKGFTNFRNTIALAEPFNTSILTTVIESLLVSDLPTDEGRERLTDIINNQTILVQVGNILTMRLASLGTWSWSMNVAVEQQQGNTSMNNDPIDEEVLQAIFLWYLGGLWLFFSRQAFKKFRESGGVWKTSTRTPPDPPRPDKPAPHSSSLLKDVQPLVEPMATELALNTQLSYSEQGGTVFFSSFESWDNLMPHDTILSLMEFLGVSRLWVDFFSKFLREPINSLEGEVAKPPRIRRRGTPASYEFSEFFKESLLFCLDFAVNQATNGYDIHHTGDDFWFSSPRHDTAVKAWKAVSEFTIATKICINAERSGTVRISRNPSLMLDIDNTLPKGDIRFGFLGLSRKTGKFVIQIDWKMMHKYIADIRQHLASERSSVISFIKSWNCFVVPSLTCQLGNPANCHGRAHLHQVLSMLHWIQREVFAYAPSSSSSPSPLFAGEKPPKKPVTGVVDYIKHLLRSRFGISDVSDAFLFFPIKLGGLGLRNPFIETLHRGEGVLKDPDMYINTNLRDEYSKSTTKTYNSRGPVSFEEFTVYREELRSLFDFPDNLTRVKKTLLEKPNPRAVVLSAAGQAAWKGLGICELYWPLVLEMYGPEAMARFGEFVIVQRELLPVELLIIQAGLRLWDDGIA